MSSPAFAKFEMGANRARVLLALSSGRGVKSQSQDQVLLHAALAAVVAGWDSYIKEVVRNYFKETAQPLRVDYASVHQLLLEASEQAAEKLNTPNWGNARNHMVRWTGYDPISDWIYSRKKLNAQQVNQYLDEIFKVRHSFAHGFSMQKFSWNTNASGVAKLTKKELVSIIRFLTHLVQQTDRGLVKYLKLTFGLKITW